MINVEKQLYSGPLVPCYISAPSAWNVCPLTVRQVQQTLHILQHLHQAWLPWKHFSCFHSTLSSPRKAHQASPLWPFIDFSVHSHDSNFSRVFPILPLPPSFRKHIRAYLLQGILTIIYVPYFLTVPFKFLFCLSDCSINHPNSVSTPCYLS